MSDFFDQVQLGTVFTYYGPRSFPFFTRGIGVAVVVGLDSEDGIIHVEVTRPSEDDEHSVDILHLPIVRSAFEKSVHQLHAVRESPGFPPSISLWRDRHRDGQVGAFSVPIWKAQQLAWETALDNQPNLIPDRVTIEYAFPKKSSDGSYKIVEVSLPRENSKGAA